MVKWYKCQWIRCCCGRFLMCSHPAPWPPQPCFYIHYINTPPLRAQSMQEVVRCRLAAYKCCLLPVGFVWMVEVVDWHIIFTYCKRGQPGAICAYLWFLVLFSPSKLPQRWSSLEVSPSFGRVYASPLQARWPVEPFFCLVFLKCFLTTVEVGWIGLGWKAHQWHLLVRWKTAVRRSLSFTLTLCMEWYSNTWRFKLSKANVTYQF